MIPSTLVENGTFHFSDIPMQNNLMIIDYIDFRSNNLFYIHLYQICCYIEVTHNQLYKYIQDDKY